MAAADVHPIQRPLKGSRISSFYPVKEIPPISSLDSAFQLQEYISLLIRKDVHDVDTIVTIPGKGKQREGSDGEGRGDDVESAESKEVTVDESCWIYEQLRRLAQDLSHPLITMLQQECTRQTCPEMKAGEWLYLCVAHGTEGTMEQCCAIDYILHILDSATSLLNSPRNFPSRLSIPVPSHRHFSSLARRLGRIFAHAYFHHRAAFAQAEAESALYARFLALTSRFELVPPDFLVIPPGIVGYEEHDGPDEYPRSMLGAALDPQRERERGREDDPRGVLRVDALGALSPNGEERREPSPRKVGRTRTDTMVHSEMASVVEELGRAAAAAAEGETTEGTQERVPIIPGDVHKAEEEAAAAQELTDVQTAVEPEPATEPEAATAPTEPEDLADDSQADSSQVIEHIEAEPNATPEEPTPPVEKSVLAEETDIANSAEPASADVPAEHPADEPAQPDGSHVEPILEAEPEAVEAEEVVAQEEDITSEPETPDEPHGEEELQPEPEPANKNTEEEHVEEGEVATAEAEEPAHVELVQADVLEERTPEEAHEETADTKEEKEVEDAVAEDDVADAHPEPEGTGEIATEA